MTVPEEDAVVKCFSVQLERHYVDQSDGAGSWNGIVYRYDKKRQRLARPFLAKLKDMCQQKDIPLSVVDERPPWKYSPVPLDQIDKNFLTTIVLDDHQVESIQLSTLIETGQYSIPTGGGKGEIIVGTCKANPVPTVILAEQRIVIDQLVSRFKLRQLDDVGLFYGGATPNGQPIIVCSVQSTVLPSMPESPIRENYEDDDKFEKAKKRFAVSLKGYHSRMKRAKQCREIIRNAEMILVDESDLASSDPYKDIFTNLFTGRKRFGYSGTPVDPEKPLAELLTTEHLGSIVKTVSRRHLERIGRIVPVIYTTWVIDGNHNDASTYAIAVDELMINNPDVHDVIRRSVEMSAAAGDRTLLLVDRDKFGELLTGILPNSAFIHGKTSPKARSTALVDFESRKLSSLVGGKILGRGLDLKGGTESLWLCTGGKLWSVFTQQIGRSVRVNSQGYGKVNDLFLRNNKHLYSHSKARLKSAIALGYQTQVVLPDGTIIDGEQFVNNRFRIPGRKK